MSIGQRISELRKSSSLSQEYVAEKLGVSRQAVSKWETDSSAPDMYNLIALAELFGVSVEYLATGKAPSSPPTPEHARKDNQQKPLDTQRILGFILLGAGLISLILGILLEEILILLSFYMLLGSVICLAVHKNIGFFSMWAFLALTALCLSGTTGNLFCIFIPSYYSMLAYGISSIWMTVSFVFWIWLVSAIVLTVIRIVKRQKAKNK